MNLLRTLPVIFVVICTLVAAILLMFYRFSTSDDGGSDNSHSVGDHLNASSSVRSTVNLVPPEMEYEKPDVEGGGEESVCTICLSELTDGNQVRRMPECSHYFHSGCIDEWLRSRGSCPTCRSEASVTPSEQWGGEQTVVATVAREPEAVATYMSFLLVQSLH